MQLEKEGNATITIINRIVDLGTAARVMAKTQDWSWVFRLAAPVRARHRPARPKRHRVVGTGVLFDLGLELMRQAHHQKGPRRLATYRDGLMISLLAARPLRRRNFVALKLHRNVVHHESGWWIEVPADETKTGGPIELPWPQELATHLEYYLSEVRPCLLTGRHHSSVACAGDALWVSRDASAMAGNSIYSQVITRTRTHLGRRINPHLFRDCLATSIAIEDPLHVGIASLLLGHRRRSTTERHYNQARAIEACRQHQNSLISLRQSLSRRD